MQVNTSAVVSRNTRCRDTLLRRPTVLLARYLFSNARPGTSALCNGAGDHLPPRRGLGALLILTSPPTTPRSTPQRVARHIPLFHGGERAARRDKINGLRAPFHGDQRIVDVDACTRIDSPRRWLSLAALNCQVRGTFKLASHHRDHTQSTHACTCRCCMQRAFRDHAIHVYRITCTRLWVVFLAISLIVETFALCELCLRTT